MVASGALAAEASAYDLVVSNAANRSGALPLAGNTVNGNIYVFTAPESGVTRVRFWLDDPQRTGTPIKTENAAPWDFAGTSGNAARDALPYDTSGIADGPHTISAAIDKSAGGTDILTATFTVANAPPAGGADVLMFSSSPSRGGPALLNNDTVAGNVYVFVPASSGIMAVRFYLDDPQRIGRPIKTDNSAPWDFAGTVADSAGRARPYDTKRLANGPHTITAAVTRTSGTGVITAGFNVLNGATSGLDLLPDLVADPPSNPNAPVVQQLADGQNHLLLKFSGSIHNIGTGALEIRGTNPSNGLMTVTGQRIYQQGGGFRDDNSRHPIIRFENTDGHNHWHLMNAARFSIWNQAGTQEVAPGAKVGFCLEDGQQADSFAVPNPSYTASQTQTCRAGQPNPANTFQGISSGWRDVYGANVYFQWIDISDLSPGLYRLGSQMDPDDFVNESNELNNGPTLMSSTVTVPGYVASPVSASASGPQAITLASQTFGSPGARRFKIVTAPQHGTLDVALNTAFTGPQVTYTPQSGYSGQDTFTYAAFSSTSQFPLNPPVATVTINVSSGAAASLQAGSLPARTQAAQDEKVDLQPAASRSRSTLSPLWSCPLLEPSGRGTSARRPSRQISPVLLPRPGLG